MMIFNFYVPYKQGHPNCLKIWNALSKPQDTMLDRIEDAKSLLQSFFDR